jgi:hypothetical protein
MQKKICRAVRNNSFQKRLLFLKYKQLNCLEKDYA